MLGALKKRFEHRPGEYRAKPVRNGLVVLGLFLFAMTYMLTGGEFLPLPKGGQVIKAEFARAPNVELPTTTVRVKGVDVGKVEKVERKADGRGAIVTMRIEDGHDFKIRRDARASIYWRTLLGFQFYIELEPGSDPQALGGATIPVSHTTNQVELDEVLAAVDKPSQATVRTMMREFDKGFEKTGPPGATIDALAPSMRQIAPGLDALRGRGRGDLTETVRSVSRLTGALARSDQELGELVGNANVALAATAARRADLGATLRDAPQVLADTSATMGRVRTTLEELDPVAAALRPGARRLDETAATLRPALRRLTPVLDDARPLLRDLRPALRRLDTASVQARALLRGLDPTVRRARTTLLPWLDRTDAGTKIKNYQAIGPTFAAVSSSAQQFDVFGHTQRFDAVRSGPRAPAFLPCHVDFPESVELDCADLQRVIGGIFGVPSPPPSSPLTPPEDGDAQPPSGRRAGAGLAPGALPRTILESVAGLLGKGSR